MATTQYKQPQKAASVVVGEQPAQDTLKNTNMSVGNIRRSDYPAAKTSGIKIRGTGAATKGTMARGPMA